jgi:hypothetical protein
LNFFSIRRKELTRFMPVSRREWPWNVVHQMRKVHTSKLRLVTD